MTEAFDAFAGSYEEDHRQSIRASGEDPAYFHDYKLACLRRKGVDETAPLLDFGCGIGNLTTRFVTRFAEVHAYDPSAVSMEKARERAPKAIFHDTHATLPRGHFETIVLSGVLHHVDPRARIDLVTEVRSLLRPGGRVFVFEHNPLNPVTRRAVDKCAFDDDAVLLFPWETRKVLRAAGFDEIELDYIVFFPRPLAFLRPLEPRLRRLAIGAQQLVIGTRR